MLVQRPETYLGCWNGTLFSTSSAAAVLALFIVAEASSVLAQHQSSFEAISIRAEKAPLQFGDIAAVFPRVAPGGVFKASHMTVEALLMFAYDLQPHRPLGGPEWLRRNAFNIEARAGRDVPPAQIKLMIQSALRERFGLVSHREDRVVNVQALVRARPDGRLGPNLTRIEECSASRVRAVLSELRWPNAFAGAFNGCSIGFETLAGSLTVKLKTPVIDASGLTDRVLYYLQAASSVLAAQASADELPALSTALREQLGLRFESRESKVSFLVIDSIHLPSEN